MLPWKCHSGHVMERCDEYNNSIKFQFYTERVLEIIHSFFLYDVVSTFGRHKPVICINQTYGLLNSLIKIASYTL